MEILTNLPTISALWEVALWSVVSEIWAIAEGINSVPGPPCSWGSYWAQGYDSDLGSHVRTGRLRSRAR